VEGIVAGKSLTRGQARTLCALAFLGFAIANVVHFYSLISQTHLPVWAAVLIVAPTGFILWLIWMGWKTAGSDEQVKPRTFALPLFLFAFCLSYYLSGRGADLLFLSYSYGFSRVHAEHLQLVHMGKFVPWAVLSGGRVVEHANAYSLWSDIRGSLMSAIFFLTFLCIYPLLPKGNVNFIYSRISRRTL
jgi:hypothetical protein